MPFLLRFQEPIRSVLLGPNSLGTATHTFVRSEQGDVDPQRLSFLSIPLDSALAKPEMPTESYFHKAAPGGTQTVTEVRQEAADRDPAVRMFDFLPKEFVR